MLHAFWRWQARWHAARFDWLFVGFLVFAAGMVVWSQLRARRLARSVAQIDACLAAADAPCASAALERLRALGGSTARTRIAEAGVAVTLGQLGDARAILAELRGVESLDSRARGRLLLVEGDLAAADARPAEARTRYAAAEPLLEAGAAEQRIARLDAAQARAAAAKAQAEAAQQAQAEQARTTVEQAQRDRVRQTTDRLRAGFADALTAIQDGRVERAQLLLADVRNQSFTLGWPAYGKLQVAFQAADQALAAIRTRDQARAAARGTIYFGGIHQQAAEDRQRQAVGDTLRTLEETLPLARRLFEEAMSAVEATPPSPTPGRPAGAYRGMMAR